MTREKKRKTKAAEISDLKIVETVEFEHRISNMTQRGQWEIN